MCVCVCVCARARARVGVTWVRLWQQQQNMFKNISMSFSRLKSITLQMYDSVIKNAKTLALFEKIPSSRKEKLVFAVVTNFNSVKLPQMSRNPSLEAHSLLGLLVWKPYVIVVILSNKLTRMDAPTRERQVCFFGLFFRSISFGAERERYIFCSLSHFRFWFGSF